MKTNRYVVISGFSLNDNNRGTAALGYGAISFLRTYHNFTNQTLLIISPSKVPFKKAIDFEINIQGKIQKIRYLPAWKLFTGILSHLGIMIPFTRFAKAWKKVDYVAAINGGDGFSDIYGSSLFRMRLGETKWAMATRTAIIQLPQTLGPFQEGPDFETAKKILKKSKNIYVRDEKFTSELEHIGVSYELKKDLSFYMKPEPFDIDIKKSAIGLNISGLAYSNKFNALSGQFDNYPYLCEKIVSFFQQKGIPVYLISHSYNYNCPEYANDDITASREFYNNLANKKNIYIVDRDLTSPQTKYLISKMSFFIGTRMHANFAAIFSKVPVFGLAYSFKFQGAFEANGIFNQTAMINNISKIQADNIVLQITEVYKNHNKV